MGLPILVQVSERNGMSSETTGVDPTMSPDLFLQLRLEAVVIRIAREADGGQLVNEKKFAKNMKQQRVMELVVELEERGAFKPQHRNANIDDLQKRFTGLKHEIRKDNTAAKHGIDARSTYCDSLMQRAADADARALRLPPLPLSSAISSSRAPHVDPPSTPPPPMSTPRGSAAVSPVKSKRKASVEAFPPTNAKRANTRGIPVSEASPLRSLGDDRQPTTCPASSAVDPSPAQKISSTPRTPHAAEVSSPPTNFPNFIQVRFGRQDRHPTPLGRMVATERLLADGSIHSGSFDELVRRVDRSPSSTCFLSGGVAVNVVSDSSSLEALLRSVGASDCIVLEAQSRPTTMNELNARMNESSIDDNEGVPPYQASEVTQSSSPIDRDERDARDVDVSPVRRSRRLRERPVIRDEADEDVDMGGMAEERESPPAVVQDVLSDHDLDEADAVPSLASSQASTIRPDEKPTTDPAPSPLSVPPSTRSSRLTDHDMNGSSAAPPVASSPTSTTQPHEKTAGDDPSPPSPEVELAVPSDSPDQIMADDSTEAVEPAQPVAPALSTADPAPGVQTPGQMSPSRSNANSPIASPTTPSHAPCRMAEEYRLDDFAGRFAGLGRVRDAVEGVEGNRDGDDDRDDFDADAETRAKMASTVIERGQLDFKLVPRFCTMMKLGASAAWNPDAVHPHELVGARIPPKSYQLLTAVIAMHEEFRMGTICTTDAVRQSVGYGINHEAGLGKTLIALYKFVLRNWLLWARTRIDESRRAEDGMHLAAGAAADARCPSDGHGDYSKMPFRCPCEPSSLSSELWAGAGATIVVTTLSLLPNFEREVRTLVDFAPLSSIWGWPVVLSLGHHDVSKFGTAHLTATLLRPFVGPPPTLHDWARRNGLSDEAFRSRVEVEGFKDMREPLPTANTPAHGVLILTTPQSLTGSSCGGVMRSSLCAEGGTNRKRPCSDDRSCFVDGSTKRTGHAKTHVATVPRLSGLRLPLAEIVVDEAHLVEQKGEGAIAHLKELVDESVRHFQAGPVVCPMTGTPRSKSPLELLAYPLIHRVPAWVGDPELRDLARWGFRAPEIFEAVRAVKVDSRLTQVHYAALLLAAGHSERSSTSAARATMVEDQSASALADAAWKRRGEPVGLALLRRAIEFRAADTYNHLPFVVLPALHQRVRPLDHTDSQARILAPLVPQYQDLMSKRKVAVQAYEGKQAAAGDIPPAQEIKGLLRYLEMCISIPHLHLILNGSTHELMAGTVLEQGWFQKPESSPWWGRVDAAYESSPKLQYVIERVNSLPFVDADPTGDPQLVKRKVRDKLIIFAYEPFIAHMILLTVRRRCPGVNSEAIYRAANATDKTERAEILARFGHRPSPREASKGNTEYGDELQVLVVCTKIGATGITLTKANEVVHFDVDPDASRYTQAPKRAHRITQTRNVTCVQLIMNYCGLEGWRLLRVRKGAEVANCLPDLGDLAAEDRAPSRVSNTDAIVPVNPSPSGSKENAIVLDEEPSP